MVVMFSGWYVLIKKLDGTQLNGFNKPGLNQQIKRTVHRCAADLLPKFSHVFKDAFSIKVTLVPENFLENFLSLTG